MDDLIRVLVADDEPLVRAGLALLLGADPQITVVAEASDGTAALHASRRLEPDVALMDIRMPGLDGLAATRALRQEGGPAVLVLTTFGTDENILRALRAGAAGFLLKDTPPADILTAVRRAAAGEPAVSPAVLGRLIDQVAGQGQDDRAERARRAGAALAHLSGREREVAEAVAAGRSNAQIGTELYMSTATVKAYVSRILAKLGCANRVQVAILVHESRG